MKQKKEVAVLAVLLLIAAGVWFFYFQRDKQIVTADAGTTLKNYQLLSVENPRIRVDKLEAASKTEYKSSGRNIFNTVVVQPPPVIPKPEPVSEQPPPPPPPPPPLVLPVKFFGLGTVPYGTVRRAFFTDGEDVFIVPEGEVLMNRFRILRVGNASVDFEEISSGRRGTAPLEEQGVSPSA
jgi:hypothetical protein